MEIEYNFTLQDDIDNWLIFNEWSNNQPFIKWTIRVIIISLILLGFYYFIIGIIDENNLKKILGIIGGIFSIISGLFFYKILNPEYLLKLGHEKEIAEEWKNKSRQEEPHKIIINSEEFTLATEFIELSWTWQAFKTYFEGKKSFLLWFYDSDIPYYIPKRIFINPDKTNDFKKILIQNNSEK